MRSPITTTNTESNNSSWPPRRPSMNGVGLTWHLLRTVFHRCVRQSRKSDGSSLDEVTAPMRAGHPGILSPGRAQRAFIVLLQKRDNARTRERRKDVTARMDDEHHRRSLRRGVARADRTTRRAISGRAVHFARAFDRLFLKLELHRLVVGASDVDE